MSPRITSRYNSHHMPEDEGYVVVESYNDTVYFSNDDCYLVVEAYHRPPEIQNKIEHGGVVGIEKFPTVGIKDTYKILDWMVDHGTALKENGIYYPNFGKYKKDTPEGKKIWNNAYGMNLIVNAALENPEESKVKENPDFKIFLDPNQNQLGYGRDETEVYSDTVLLNRIEEMGKSFGMDVGVDFGDMDEELLDAEDMNYTSFKELHAFKKLFKVVSSMFRQIPGHKIYIPKSKEETENYIRNEIEKVYAKGDVISPWNKYKVDKDNSIETIESILEKIHFYYEDDDNFQNGMLFCGRVITKQQEPYVPLDEVIENDTKMILDRVKGDGYHCGVHWSMNAEGFYDAGEWVEGMETILLQGWVPLSSVDWRNTVATNYEFTQEKELWLYPGRPILQPCVGFNSQRFNIWMKPKSEMCFVA